MITHFNNEQEQLLKSLNKLKLYGISNALENQFRNEGTYSSVTFIERLKELILRQESFEANSKYESLIKSSKVKQVLNFETLNLQKNDGINTDELRFIVSNEWVDVCFSNLVIQGPCGVGKTALSIAIVDNLCKSGISVRFIRFSDLLDEIAIKYNYPDRRASFKKTLGKPQVLVIDDLGSSTELDLITIDFIKSVVDDRYVNKKPIVITSQLSTDSYRLFFGNKIESDAIVDRLLHPCKIITLQGDSKR